MKALGYISAMAIGIVLRGFVVMYGWSWFFVPLGAPVIGFAHALGLSAMVALLTHQVGDQRPSKAIGQIMLEGILSNVLFFGFMYAYQLFM